MNGEPFYSFASIGKNAKTKDGWYYTEKIKPPTYALVLLKDGDKSICGWWTGGSWDGLNVEPDKKYVFWRRKKVTD